MTTNFFTTLMPLIKGLGSVTITISAHEDGVMTISTLPKPKAGVNDEALQNLNPLILSAPASELDEEYFSKITKVTEKSAELFCSVESFERQLEEVKKNTEMEKEKRKKEEEELRKNKKKMEANDAKASTQIELLKGSIAKKDFGACNKAISSLEQLKGQLSDGVQKKAEEAIEKAKQVISSPSLFN